MRNIHGPLAFTHGHFALRSRRPFVPAVIAIMMALTSLTIRAWGQAPAASSDAREKERTSLYREGLSLAEAGRWEEALPKFEAVVAIRSAPRALIALAAAQEKLGRLVGAKRTYTKARVDAQAAREADIAERAAAAQTAVEARLPHLVVRFYPTVTDAAILLDETPVPSTAEPLEIDPGEHRIAVSATGRQSFDLRFRVAESERKEMTIELKPVEPPTPEPAKPASVPALDRSSSGLRQPPWPVWALGGAGVAATAVGLIVRFNGQADYNDAAASCRDGHCVSPNTVERGNAARDRMLTGTLVAGVGVLAIAGAGAWWAVSATRFDASPTAGGFSVRVSGAF